MTDVVVVGVLQALGLVTYIGLIATIFNNSKNWFSHLNNFTAPIVMLTLLSTSILICGLITLGYPVRLFWIKKQPQKALKIVGVTVVSLVVLLVAIVTALSLLR